MMNKKKIPIVVFIFFLAFIPRIVFILTTRPYPIDSWSDAGYYNNIAKAIYGILSHFHIFLREFLSGNLGRGQGILNTYGLRLPFGIFHRGLIHPVFIAVIYLFSGLNNFRAVWIVQGIMDSLSVVLVYFIGKRIFTTKVAFFASILTAVYLPFIRYTTTLMQETLIIFLLLSTILFLVKAIQEKSKMNFFWAGFFLFLITTGRLAFMYLFWVLLTCFIYILLKEKKIYLRRKAIFVLLSAFLIPLILWMGLIAAEFGKFGKIMVGPGAISLYRSNIVLTQGWFTDEDRLSLGPHLTRRLKSQGFVWNDKNDKWPPDDILFKAVWKEFKENPKASLLLILEKTRRLWLSNIKTDVLTKILQRLAVLLAVIGIPLAFFKKKISILLSGIIIYVTLLYSLVAAAGRYSLTAMPFVFLVSSFTLSYVWKSFSAQDRERKKKFFLLSSLGLAFYVLSRILTVPIMLAIFNSMSPTVAFVTNVLFKNFFIFLISLSIYLLLSKTLSKPKRIRATIFSYLCFAILFNSWAFFDKSWKEWYAPLSSSNQRIQQEIVIPQDFLGRAKKAYLKIDMQQSEDSFGKLLISVNGEIIKIYNKKLMVENAPFPAYFEYRYTIKDPARMRRWFSIPIEILRLKQSANVTIELLYKEMQQKGWVRVYGDYSIKNSDKIFIGPLFARTSFETSIQKYHQDGDYRINGKVKLGSINTVSSFYDGRRWSSFDLSDNRGIQNGEYRIRLEIVDGQGNSFIF